MKIKKIPHLKLSLKNPAPFVFLGFFTALFLSFTLNVFAINIGRLDVQNVTPQTVAAMFKPALTFLKQNQVEINVLVPKFIFSNVRDGFLYAIPNSDRPDSYWIDVTGNPNCNGATSCSYIVFQGEKVGNPEVLTLEQELALGKESYARVTPDKRDPNAPAVVTLDNGMKAVFHPWFFFFHYTSSYLSWDDNGVRYQLIMKKGDKAAIVKMVNSIYKD